MAEVQFQNITKTFGQTEVLTDISLDIADGEFCVFVGPSGCGKSTTLRILAGLEMPTSGRVFIDQKDVTDIAPKDRDIAMVFQNYALYPHMTVFENMAFGLKMRKFSKPEIQQRVEEAAEILSLKELLSRKPKALSGGQRQRVALGRAIVRKPKVFLFDEPLSNLDAKLRVQMRIEIKKLHQRLKTTMVYVTHDQIEAMTMGQRIVVMNKGYIQQADEPLRVYNYPNNMFVAGFIGSPAMNFMDVYSEKGRVIIDGMETVLHYPLSESSGKQLIMGVRPEHIYMVDSQSGLPAYVELVELLGDHVLARLKIKTNHITARFPSTEAIHPGERIFIGFKEDKIYFFDKKSGKRL